MLVTQTELDAVNHILSAIGSAPVTTLEGDMDIDVVNARRILASTNRDIQRKGWDFNKVTRTLSPRMDNHRIPWDRTIITVEIVEGIDYDDLPDAFKTYVTAKAAVDFQARYFGDASISEDLQMALTLAHQDIVQYDMEMKPLNMLQVAAVPPVLERS